MRNTYLLGNWKMQGSQAVITALLGELQGGLALSAEASLPVMAVFPPAPYLSLVKQQLHHGAIELGGQTVSEYLAGAYTGEMAAEMLIDVGCRYVLIGHSERRSLFSENNARIAAKFWRAIESGLVPVLCVGETLAQWQEEQTFAVLAEQLTAVFDRADRPRLSDFIVAYEPVWAIGTGKVASPDYAQQVHAFIRQSLSKLAIAAETVPIVYGGSVKSQNFAALLAMPDIDGGLVGGASWQASEFIAMASLSACLR